MKRNSIKDKIVLLKKLSTTPIVEIACKQAGIPRSTYYRWRKSDNNFANMCDETIDESAGRISDLAESQLINAIKESNMTAIMFWLKHHHRIYRNRIEIDAKLTNVQQALSPEQAELVSQALRLAGLINNDGDNQNGKI
jgi:hypothetical protein